MKKRIWLLLAAAVLAALFISACTGTNESQNGAESNSSTENSGSAVSVDDPYKGVFRAGFGRVNITPEASAALPLAGYGNTQNRLSTGFLDYIFTTCIAISDENDETLLMYTTDIISSNDTVIAEAKQMITDQLGISVDHIVFTATHTHSSIDQSQVTMVGDFLVTMKSAFVQAAQQALADRAPCTFEWTTADLKGYNYVRHYFTNLDESVGDNHGQYAVGTLSRHTTEANNTMFILKMERDTEKDIYLSNWRAHPVLTGRGSSNVNNQKTNISADWISPIRSRMEQEYDAYFAYFQGDSGNMNPLTELPASVEYRPPTDYREYGNEIADIMIAAVNAGMEKVETGPIRTMQTTFTGRVNHADEDKLAIANTVYGIWTSTGDIAKCLEVAIPNGIDSQYEAGAILTRSAMGETLSFEIHATVIGDFAFTHAPFELFDTNGDFIRDNSPVKHTFVLGYSNQSWGYLPSQFAYEYGCYEADTTRFAVGTAEELASRFVEMLTELKNQ